IVAGGSGAGKTTLLNALSSYISTRERIVTIEDAAELRLQQMHVITLETRPANVESHGEITIRDLLRNALRMRPDRIVIGECRGPEALDMLQAMNTGHDGSLTTIHANGPRDALARIETMVLMSGADLPLRAIREQVVSAIDLVVYVERMQDGTRKITQISEVRGYEGDLITMQDLFVFQRDGFDGQRVLGAPRPTETDVLPQPVIVGVLGTTAVVCFVLGLWLPMAQGELSIARRLRGFVEAPIGALEAELKIGRRRSTREGRTSVQRSAVVRFLE